jgi:N-acetylglutamate synthase-like GNAT family acetyltransferase
MTVTNLLEDVRLYTNDVALLRDVACNPLYFSKLICEENGNAVGISLMRITSEMTWVPLPTATKFEQCRAFKALLAEQTAAARKFGINQAHVWTDIDSSLMQHLGFQERSEKSYILHF